MDSIYLFSKYTLKREVRLLFCGILSFFANTIIFPKRSLCAGAIRNLILSSFMKGPFRVSYIMKGVVIDDISKVFLDTDVIINEGVSIKGGLEVGRKTYIGKDTIINGPVKIGSGCFVNYVCEINAKTTIENNVVIGPNVRFFSKTHEIGSSDFRAGNLKHDPIRIERGVWIGGGVIVLGGVTIGGGSVVGAGSVVTMDVPENSLIVGNPAKVIKKLGPGYGGSPEGSPKTPPEIKWA